MSAGSKSGDGLDEACTVMEASMLEEEGYFNPTTSSGAGLNESGGKRQLENLCRVCANVSDYFIPIFEGEGLEHQLDMKIQKHLPIQVHEADSLPGHVCYQCASTLIAWHDLVTSCIEADKKLQQLLQEDDDEYEGREEKVVEFFNEPPVDSDGEDLNEPSTSVAVVAVKKNLPPQKRRTTGKGKQQRKSHVENASSVSDAKTSTVAASSKEAGTGQKAVESASSTERSSTRLKTSHSASKDTQWRSEFATMIKKEPDNEYDDNGEDYGDGDNENGLENLNTDVESSTTWLPSIHSYCKPEKIDENYKLSNSAYELLAESQTEGDTRLKSRKRSKPHIIEFESFGFPVETENCNTNIFVCHICGEAILGAIVDMEEHLKFHDASYKLQKHSYTEPDASAKSHNQNLDLDTPLEKNGGDVEILDEKISVFFCKPCKKFLKNKVLLKYHNKKYHASKSKPSSVYHHSSAGNVQSATTKRKRKVYVCRACKSEFPDLASFKQHRPGHVKKSKIGELIRSACSQFRDPAREARLAKRKYLHEKREQVNAKKNTPLKKMVRSVCSELLAADLEVEQFLLKRLRGENQAFKNKKMWRY